MKRKSIILSIGVISIFLLVLSFGVRNSIDRDLKVEEYFPRRQMTKKFSGGYEKQGFTHIVDRIENDKVQISQWDTGTGVMRVYQISNNNIRLIYSEAGESFPEDYINGVTPNRDSIILKAPLAVGTKWISSDNSESNEITGVNVIVFTRAGMFYALEVTHKSGEFESRSYFAKNVGLIKRSYKGYGSDNLIKFEYK